MSMIKEQAGVLKSQNNVICHSDEKYWNKQIVHQAGDKLTCLARMSKSHSENKTKTSSRWGKESLGQESTMRVTHILCFEPGFLPQRVHAWDSSPVLAWPLSKEEFVSGSSDPSHNLHLFSTQPHTRVGTKIRACSIVAPSCFSKLARPLMIHPFDLVSLYYG